MQTLTRRGDGDAAAGLGLHFLHMSGGPFSHDAGQITFLKTKQNKYRLGFINIRIYTDTIGHLNRQQKSLNIHFFIKISLYIAVIFHDLFFYNLRTVTTNKSKKRIQNQEQVCA